MSREIRLRAWDKRTNKMFPVLAIDFTGVEIRKGEPSIIVQENDGCLLLKEVELMQFTGLHDKNGNEIYEGDFLKDEYNRILLVEWWQYAFTLKAITKTNFVRANYIIQWFLGVPFLPEIIGNRYENPDLLIQKAT